MGAADLSRWHSRQIERAVFQHVGPAYVGPVAPTSDDLHLSLFLQVAVEDASSAHGREGCSADQRENSGQEERLQHGAVHLVFYGGTVVGSCLALLPEVKPVAYGGCM